MIAAPARRDAIADSLRAADIDLDAVRGSGQLRELDAVQLADDIAPGGVVFSTVFRRLADDVCPAPSPRTWVYGEIVAVLWGRGQLDAALAVEDLWNDVLAGAGGHLLCGYPAIVAANGRGAAFDAIGRRHTEVALGGLGQAAPADAQPAGDGAAGSEPDRLRLRAVFAEAARLDEQRDGFAAMLELLDARVAEAGRARDRLLASASHELRTPLTAIIGFSETLLARRSDLDEDLQLGLEVILRNGRHLAELVDDLLLAATLRESPAHPVATSLLLLPVLEEQVARRAVDGVELSIAGGAMGQACSAQVIVDARHLHRIVDQLLDNALRHGRPPVRLIVELTGPQARIVVEDQGVLLSSDLVARLFEPFTQAPVGDRRPTLGLGLGLAIASELAAANGGSLTYEASDGRNRFVLSVPWA